MAGYALHIYYDGVDDVPFASIELGAVSNTDAEDHWLRVRGEIERAAGELAPEIELSVPGGPPVVVEPARVTRVDLTEADPS